MATELSRNAVIKTYARWAPVYDVVFGSVFENARRMAVEASERVGGRILEVGVGTGISLPYYAANSRIVGIDISEPMLKVARRRVVADQLRHVERLEVMDAEDLEFADASSTSWSPNTWSTRSPIRRLRSMSSCASCGPAGSS
jgi:phosphatidylethanolamine/phosphatidyl-N-methylethanolamine N-methyltransferase